MNELKECALCGAAYLNAERHQAFHDDLDAWIQLVELEVEERLKTRQRVGAI